MAKINADPVVLERAARELYRIADEMDTQGKVISTAGSDTAAIWKSRYTGQFLESVNRTRQKVNTSAEQVRTLAKALRSIVAEVHRTEEEIRRRNASV